MDMNDYYEKKNDLTILDPCHSIFGQFVDHVNIISNFGENNLSKFCVIVHNMRHNPNITHKAPRMTTARTLKVHFSLGPFFLIILF